MPTDKSDWSWSPLNDDLREDKFLTSFIKDDSAVAGNNKKFKKPQWINQILHFDFSNGKSTIKGDLLMACVVVLAVVGLVVVWCDDVVEVESC